MAREGIKAEVFFTEWYCATLKSMHYLKIQ